ASKTTIVGSARARFEARKAFAAPTGNHSAAATALTARSIRRTRTSSTSSRSAATWCASTSRAANRSRCVRSPVKAKKSGQQKSLRPEPGEGEAAFRFHWLAPLIMSAHTPGTLYLAGNEVFKITDRGEHWTAISPDLSTKDLAKMQAVGSGAENYGVVY